MIRNLDMTALRAFVTVAEAGGVTRAAGLLHLTQSAVSMQIRRLEDALGRKLFERSGRGVVLSAEGEHLLGYARRMLALNDEIWSRLTGSDFEGEITLGVPHDIVYPALPPVLRRFHAAFPRMKVTLVSAFTAVLRQYFAAGECDVVLTTEDGLDAGGVTLDEVPLVWAGAPDGQVCLHRPLRLGFETRSVFRATAQAALDRAGLAWEMAVTSEMSRTIEATVSADLAVTAFLEGTVPETMAQIDASAGLPDLGTKRINLYAAETITGEAAGNLVAMLSEAYSPGPVVTTTLPVDFRDLSRS